MKVAIVLAIQMLTTATGVPPRWLLLILLSAVAILSIVVSRGPQESRSAGEGKRTRASKVGVLRILNMLRAIAKATSRVQGQDVLLGCT